jgi:hypothetical protein
MLEHESQGERPSTLPRRVLFAKGAVAAAALTGAAVVNATPAAAAPLAPLLVPFGPQRLYDSRDSQLGPLLVGQERLLAGQPIPNELAYLLNVTVTATTGSGWINVFSADISWPGTSTVNWSGPGQEIANTAYTFLRPSDRGIVVRAGGAAGSSTHFVIDLTGMLSMFDLAGFTVASTPSSAGPQRGYTAEATTTSGG